MICVSSCVMVSPKPIPGAAVARACSTRSNGWKMRAASAGAMPMPVSATSNSAIWLRQPSRRVTPPAVVNLMALDSRLIRICRSRRSSVYTTAGQRSGGMKAKSSPFPAACKRNMPANCSVNSASGTASRYSSMRPASILAMSSRPSISPARCSPLRRMMPMLPRLRASRAPSRSSSWA